MEENISVIVEQEGKIVKGLIVEQEGKIVEEKGLTLSELNFAADVEKCLSVTVE